MRVLTESHRGQEIELSVGDRLTVRLNENASTGFRWVLDPIDSALMDVGGETHAPSHSNRIGAGGTVEWILTARAAGKTHIGLKYLRPWEGERSAVDQYDITLQIAR